MQNPAKVVGSTLILIGTAIGAGMLALPMVSAKASFIPASTLMIAIWALMGITALLILEVNLTLEPYKNSLQSMARKTLGRGGQIITWLVCLALLYSLTAAYISGNTSLLAEAIQALFNRQLPDAAISIIFTLIFGSIVCYSTRAVDVINRGLMTVKAAALLLVLVLLTPHINPQNFVPTNQHHFSALWLAAPIFLTAFGFHTVIPSITNYIGKDVRIMRKIIIFGTSIPLVIYLLWLACTLGIVPLTGNNSFALIAKAHGSVGNLVASLDAIVHNKWVSIGVNGFSDIAMTTSFLGVTLGLFDFLADGCKRANNRSGRLQTAALTFIPPLIFALYYPQGFILALGYASIFVAILLVIIPALMAYKLRQQPEISSSYRVFGGTPLLVLIIVIGILLITIQVWQSF